MQSRTVCQPNRLERYRLGSSLITIQGPKLVWSLGSHVTTWSLHILSSSGRRTDCVLE